MTLDMTFEARESLIKRDSIDIGRDLERIKIIRTALNNGVSKEFIINSLEFTEEEYAEVIKPQPNTF